ncbi:hypothetical protein HB48_000706 [Salmonella enterica subsp. enterica]|nr:hypothetical protein [Salmonella enterica subsp. enterica serovar Farmsen]
MKISTERAEVALKHCKRMRLQINPAYSDAGDWWDNGAYGTARTGQP